MRRLQTIIRAVAILWAFCAWNSDALYAQGSNTCAGAAASPITLPFTANNQSTCGDGNDYTGTNACNTASFGNNYGGADWIYAFTPTQNGYINIVLNNIQATGWAFPTLTLFDACPGTVGSCLAMAQGSTWSGQAALLQQVQANQTYYLLVDAYMSGNSYASCYSFNLSASLITTPAQAACTNMGFNSGNLNGWTGTLGTSITGSSNAQTPTYNATAINIANGRQTIMTGGNDPCAGFPRVDPLGGPFSVRLGNSNTGAEAEQLLQTFAVSPSNSSFTYRYAVVFEDPGHTSPEQPFFRALLRDQNGEVIPCSEFIVSAAADLPGFFSSTTCSGVVYKPWSTVNVDLSNYLGQNVTVEFTTGDCSQGGHYGYAYIDAACAPSVLADLGDTICPGQSVMLTAPTGYQSYLWQPSGSTSQTITVSPSASTTYTLSLVAFNGCTSQFQIPVVVAPIPVASFVYQAPACDLPVQLQSTASVSTGTIASTQWTIPSGNPSTASQAVVNVSYPGPGPGTYPVTLNLSSDQGCTASITQNVVVPPCEFRVSITGDTLCTGTCYTFVPNLQFGIPPYSYQWSTGSTANQILVCPANTTIYTVTVTDANGDIASDTAQITISNGPQFNPTLNPPTCFGTNNGSIQSGISGYGPFQVLWSSNQTTPDLSNISAGTYTISATDAFGCPADTTLILSQPLPVSASATPVAATCNQNNGSIVVNTIAGGTAPYTLSIDGNAPQTNTQFSNLAAGNHVITVSDQVGCTFTFTLDVPALSTPSALALGNTNPTCGLANGIIQVTGISGGVGPYALSLNGLSTQAFIGAPIQWANLDAGAYQIQLTDASGCTLDTTYIITMITGPSGIALSTSSSTCAQNNGLIQITGVLGGTPAYLYSFNGGTPAYTNTFPNLASGTYALSVSDANQCATDTVVVLDSIPTLVSAIQTLRMVSCYNGSDGSAAISINQGSAPIVAQWSDNATGLHRDSLVAGSYSVILTDAQGCQTQHSFDITQPTPMQFHLSNAMPVCNQANGSIQVVQLSGGTAPYQYSLNNGVYANIGLFQNLAPNTYTISVRDSQNCITSQNTTLSMPPFPTAMSTSVTDATCGNSNGSISINSITSGMPPFTCSFGSANPDTIALFPIQFNFLPEGDYSIVISDANGCGLDTIRSIAQQEGPSAMVLVSDPSTCDLSNANLQVANVIGGTPPYSYALDQQPYGNQMSWNGLASGAHLVQIRDANQCPLDSSTTIAALENLSINAFIIQNISCYGYEDGALQVNIQSGFAPFSYSWSNGDTTTQTLALGTGTYTVNVSDSNNCQQSFTVYLPQPEPMHVEVSGPDQVCAGDPIQLHASGGGGTGHVDILWPQYNSMGEDLTVVPVNTRNYIAMAQDENGCNISDSTTVLYRLRPEGNIVPDETAGCAPLCVDFSFASSGTDTISNYQWHFSNGMGGSKGMQKICFLHDGIQSAQVHLTNQYGCSNTISAEGLITVYPLPNADFRFNPHQPDIVEPEVRFYNESTDATAFRWAFGDGALSTQENPTHAYADTGSYTICLRVTSGFGCVDSVCKTMKLDPFPTIYAPNVFTPNEDGHNERFKVVVTYATDFRLEIFNRWGELIHVSEDPDEGWDGTYKGNPVQEDVYVWKAYVTNSMYRQKELIGRVTVVE
jgi:gliding motility-associated-like protein